MIGAPIGTEIGGNGSRSGILSATYAIAGIAALSAVGSSTASSSASISGTASLGAVGAGVLSGNFSIAGTASASFVGGSIYSFMFSILGTSISSFQSIILPITGRHVLQDPVDCVLAGQQMEFRKGRAPKAALRHAFNE